MTNPILSASVEKIIRLASFEMDLDNLIAGKSEDYKQGIGDGILLLGSHIDCYLESVIENFEKGIDKS